MTGQMTGYFNVQLPNKKKENEDHAKKNINH